MVGILEYKSYGSGFITIITPRLLKPGNAHWSHRPPGADPTTPPDTTPAGTEESIDPGRIWWATNKNSAPRMRWCRQPGHEGAGRHLRDFPPHGYQGELVHKGNNPTERSECRMVLLNFSQKLGLIRSREYPILNTIPHLDPDSFSRIGTTTSSATPG
jgi:hypothetical protein